jgi:hypothetical protein
VNGCSHPDAIQRVFEQIDGGPARPVCADLPGGIVPFPPRNESFAFRQDLEVKYRDGLKRGPTSTYVDMEGSLVWTQEYLRYRVNACGHVAGTAKVFQQIDGGPIAPVCMDALSGLWHGESDYINAPFTADLLLSGTRVSGVYRDQKDQGSIGGTYTGGEDVTLQVNFGDTGFTMEGEFDGPNRIRGTFRVAVLGNRLFHFEMTR